MTDLTSLTLANALDGMEKKQFSSAELTDAFLGAIEQANPALNVASIRSILKNGRDRAVLDETPDHEPLRHGNIRGQGYFH